MESINLDDLVRKYNLSPMEIIMLSFDYARVKKENCYGTFESLLKNYNIKCFNYILFGNRVKHTRSAIYIKDDKYNVNGIYFFDLIWSLKYDKDDEAYKYVYNYFAKTKDYYKLYDTNAALEDYFIGDFAAIADNFYDVALYDDYNDISELDIDVINNISEVVDGKSLNLPYRSDDFSFEELYKIYEKINNYDLLLSKPIPGETFLELIFNVNRVKFLEGYDNDLDYEYFKYVFYNSDWKFSEKSIYNQFRNQNYETEKEKFHANIYNIENFDTIFKTIDFYSENTNLEGRINEVKRKEKCKLKII